MRPLLKLLIAAFVGLAAVPLQAAHTQVRLVLAADTARPGDTVLAGVHLQMALGWHTYWKNPGDAGIATSNDWHLPPGVTIGEIQWPVPEKQIQRIVAEKDSPEDLVDYVYEGEVVLLVPLKLSPDLKPGPLELKADVSWLACKISCVKEGGPVSATLNIGAETKRSADADLIEAWQKKLPRPGPALSATALWEGPEKDGLRPLILEWNSSSGTNNGDFYPDPTNPPNQFDVKGATEQLSAAPGKIRLRKQIHKYAGIDWPKQIAGVLVEGSGEQKVGFETTVPVGARSAVGPKASISQSLWKNLLYAFLGGLILNIMPCVLPVIALKILGFISDAHNEPRHVRTLGFVYAAGVLISFLALALIVVGLQAAGRKVGWGIQFSNPYFLVVMTVLVTLIALNLFGVFEVTLGGRTLGAAAALSSKHGVAGAFFNGLLATILATSCSAPILGSAIGFAFAQPPFIIIVILLMVGVGLAAPYVILTCRPAWLKFLPKPGAWMEKFKIVMGFPMLGAVIWLLSIAALFYGDRTWWLAVFLVFLAVAAWIYGEFVQRGGKRPGLASAIALLLLVTGYVYAIENHLDWRRPGEESKVGGIQLAPRGYAWEPWSREAIERAQGEGRPVIVDFTATWCPNCQVNVKPTLSNPSVLARLREVNAVALVADYSRFPDNLTDELRRYGRAAVPLVLVYPADPAADAIVLPEFITAGIVLKALDHAMGNRKNN